MKKVIILVIFSISLFASPERRLRKLSMHIKGVGPDLSEYQELQATPLEQREDFFLEKTRQYLSTTNHQHKMNYRLNELFRLSYPAFKDTFNDRSSINQLFKEMAKKNLSLNELLVGKKYSMMNVENPSSDIGFYGTVLPDENRPYSRFGIFTLPPGPENPDDPERESRQIIMDFPQDDNRIAGSITTNRFFSRYNNTPLNKNRRRAAAVFRIFLCDDMEAAIPQASADFNYVLDFVFPQRENFDLSEQNITSKNDEHGNRKDCMACHYKLDPMGKVFGGSGRILDPTAYSGSLTFKANDGSLIDQKVTGLGELGEAITQQEDYKACQVKHLWNWFIGEDRPLSKEKEQSLIEQFDINDGRLNDMISYMVNLPDFYQENTQQRYPLAVKARKFLSRCTTCHEYIDVPRFDQWPIGGSKDSMLEWTSNIYKQLGLDGSLRSMPTEESSWQPTNEELEMIKQWIKEGAPNENGERQI